jgi:hypothetical protein
MTTKKGLDMALAHDVAVIGATQFSVPVLGGSTFPVKFSVPAFCIGVQLSVVSAGNSGICYLLPNAISGATVGGATNVANVLGYPLPGSIGKTTQTEAFPVDGPASFYLAAQGNACTVAALFYLSGSSAPLA